MNRCDDAALLAAVGRGDRAAFERLYRKYHPRLARFVANLNRRPSLVQEVVNDTMMVVWKRSDSFRGESQFSTWLFGIAYRKAMKAHRREDQPIEDASVDERPSPDGGPDQAMGRSRSREILLRALDELSPEHRAVIDLTYFQEIGYQEIAEIMACPIDTVKTRMFYARRRLRRSLMGELSDWL